MAKRETQKQETRQKLLNAAAACFAEKGYSACSVSDIAARAGASQGNLYVHFKNKEDLFKTMIQEEHGQGADKIRQALALPPYLDAILNLLADCIQNVGFPVDHRLWTEILAVAARDESVRQAFLASDRAMREVLLNLLQKAAEAGEIDGSLDFEEVSIWLYALVDGLIARCADTGNLDFGPHLNTFKKLVGRALRP